MTCNNVEAVDGETPTLVSVHSLRALVFTRPRWSACRSSTPPSCEVVARGYRWTVWVSMRLLRSGESNDFKLIPLNFTRGGLDKQNISPYDAESPLCPGARPTANERSGTEWGKMEHFTVNLGPAPNKSDPASYESPVPQSYLIIPNLYRTRTEYVPNVFPSSAVIVAVYNPTEGRPRGAGPEIPCRLGDIRRVG